MFWLHIVLFLEKTKRFLRVFLSHETLNRNSDCCSIFPSRMCTLRSKIKEKYRFRAWARFSEFSITLRLFFGVLKMIIYQFTQLISLPLFARTGGADNWKSNYFIAAVGFTESITRECTISSEINGTSYIAEINIWTR